MVESLKGEQLDPHYLGYFECFNRQLFFEAHEVLEALWLPERGKPNDLFYKGLIQLAGAFVHLQKNRLAPAASLFKLADKNLGRYAPVYEGLEVGDVQKTIAEWLALLESEASRSNPLGMNPPPKLFLTPPIVGQG